MIISILGTSGAFKNRDNCTPIYDDKGNIKFQIAKYNSEILGKKSAKNKNSTEFLLENFDEKFIFIGTQCAIDFQKIILAETIKGKDIDYVTIEDDSLDDIFEKILELLQEEKGDTILDITHGFRHQPIMAIFASTLSQFLERKNLKIIFAKEVEMFKEYTYIYLDEYIEITQISLLLTGFIRTLNFIPVENMKLLNNKLFEDFSKSLLSNDMMGVEKHYLLLKDELRRLEKNEEFKHIENLLIKVKDELRPLDMLAFFEPYQKYILLSKITVEKNYIIVGYAYIFESLREYCSYKFEHICRGIEFKDDYAKNTAVINTILNFRQAKFGTEILNKYKGIYKKNKIEFQRVRKLYEQIRKRRNALAHINTTSNFEDIKSDLIEIIKKVEKLFEDKILDNIRV